VRLVCALLVVVALAGCESTQTKSARLERAAKSAKKEKGLQVKQAASEIAIEKSTLLQDGNGGVATVVEMRNQSAASLVALPIAVNVRDAAGKSVYSNDAPGLDASLVSVPALAAGENLFWVNDQVTVSAPGKDVEAKVGVGGKPGPATLPQMEITGLKATQDAAGSLSVVGDVTNRSQVAQKRLVVFVVGRKAGKIVSAGRAIVDQLAPGKTTHFSAFPIGDPQGAELSASAPPTVVT
jgi:hypothetical protein